MPVVARKAKKTLRARSQTDFRKLAPDTEETLLEALSTATDEYGWDEVGGIDEKNLFDTQYNQIKQSAYRKAGLTAFKLYEEYKDLVEAAVMLLSSDDKADENFHGLEAASDQILIKQMDTDTFGIAAGDRTFGTGGTGAFDAVTRNTTTGNPYTMTSDAQMGVIFYYQQSLNPRVIESVQETINDDVGDRQPFDIISQALRGDQGILTRPGALVVEDDKDYELAAQALQDADIDLLPQGVEIVTASEASSIV